ncbi:UNVERIFIED_CONTAM: Chromatin remodeling protein EBS [Sesamum indicum]
MGMTIEEAKKLDHFLCSDCSSDDDTRRSLNSFPVSPAAAEEKVIGLYAYPPIHLLSLGLQWSQSAERGDKLVWMHHEVVPLFLHTSSSIVVVLWNCTVQRDTELEKSQRLFLI